MTRTAHAALLLVIAAGCDSASPEQADAATGDAMPDSPVDAPPLPSMVTLFVTDFGSGNVYRYRVTPTTTPPIPDLTFNIPGALSPLIVPVSGELVLGDVSMARLIRVGQPFGTAPGTTGSVTGLGITTQVQQMRWIEDEVWVVNPMGVNVIRLRFDAAGNASAGGPGVAATNGRGIVYDEAHRQVFVTECCGTNTVKRFALVPNGMTSPLPSITGGGLDNPHAMVVTPWNELLVANANPSTILRYKLDVAGSPTANGTITGNGLALPIDMVLTPWNELYVVNQGTGRISRFTFDDVTHEPTARDDFAVPSAVNLAWLTMY